MLCRSSFSKILIPRGLSRQYLRMSGGDSSVTRPPPQTERQAALRAEFLAREEEWEEGVVYSNLSEREKLIHEKHNQAVRDLHFTYDDPESGLKVLTRLRHFLKGTCCGNACRHYKARMEKEEAVWEVTESEIEEFMAVAERLVRECGDIIAEAIRSQTNVEIQQKDAVASEGHGSAVLTETDMKVEQHLIRGLKTTFPDHQFIGEETVSENGLIKQFTNAPTWIIDPIDGTMNFIHSNPLVCTSVGLTINRKLVAGLVNCPMIGHLYSAIKGKGAWLNGSTKLKCSGVKDIQKAMMIMELPVGANEEKKRVGLSNLTEMLSLAHSVRAPGPAALDIAWVGAGSADSFFHFGIHCWDMAAGALIVSEAGGVVLDPSGGEFDLMSRDILVCSSRQLAEHIISFLQIYKTERDLTEKYSYL